MNNENKEIRILMVEDVESDAELMTLELRRAGLDVKALLVDSFEELARVVSVSTEPHTVHDRERRSGGADRRRRTRGDRRRR